jgi:hypothetical protein
MQQQQQAGVQPPPNQLTAQQQFQQAQTGAYLSIVFACFSLIHLLTGSTASAKPTGSSTSAPGNTQDPGATLANADAWTQYW